MCIYVLINKCVLYINGRYDDCAAGWENLSCCSGRRGGGVPNNCSVVDTLTLRSSRDLKIYPPTDQCHFFFLSAISFFSCSDIYCGYAPHDRVYLIEPYLIESPVT